ncbi:alpha/beta fold hydrolase [Halotalea alkalilenta]|uniref:alpha/beta fold hydrolase n=1 Tax=Halotalea alkalilenta TaxID=376489 RepID=UPI0005BC0614|nr:alpha/beta hydrolase [Halotalea alkalilenta]
MFEGFEPFDIDVGDPDDDVRISGLIKGSGPALLLLHGHPQNHRIWHRVSAALAERFTVVLTDLRGYGASSKPPGTPDHANYSKRAMARDQHEVMQRLGFARYSICAHDRGARVAHRLALDHPQAVERMMLLDIAPTLAMYEATDRAFATAYFHWFLLIQPSPLPERLISAAPHAWVDGVMGGRHAGLSVFAPEALESYRTQLEDPAAVHGMCEDYRASATIDLEHDRFDLDQGRRLELPLKVLWGAHSTVGRCFDPMREWRKVARRVEGRALDCGHYIPEERPDRLLDELHDFMRTP